MWLKQANLILKHTLLEVYACKTRAVFQYT